MFTRGMDSYLVIGKVEENNKCSVSICALCEGGSSGNSCGAWSPAAVTSSAERLRNSLWERTHNWNERARARAKKPLMLSVLPSIRTSSKERVPLDFPITHFASFDRSCQNQVVSL